ncbi:MAG: aldo/keto reductase [Chloroflexi bacterium]|nr:aldo/keto reductase [Chloroflexota bacterium]|tara:strand:+ start:414 stop:1232 length:819 start_codon:yes stop_codon:yes gene_type:complete
MDRRPLSNTGETIPSIGIGTWRYLGDPLILQKAIELGANLIDTAEAYETEEFVGKAISGIRTQCFIATKVSGQNLKSKDLVNACERSLVRLGIDTIDLYQVHWPNSNIPISETMEGMAKLLEQGKIRFVGVSNFSVSQMQAANESLKSLSGNHGIVSNQVPYSLFNREIEEELLPFCEKNHITVIGYSPLEQGRFLNEVDSSHIVHEVLAGVVKETGGTAAQVLIKWAIQKNWTVTIPQTNKILRVDENFGPTKWELTKDQYKALSDASKDL